MTDLRAKSAGYALSCLAVLTLLAPGARAQAQVPEKLSMRAAVQRAMERSAAPLVAQAEVQRAEALQRQARASSWPTLAANVVYTRLDGDRTLAGRVLANENQLSANLGLLVPLVAPRAWAASTRASDAVAVARVNASDVRRQAAVAAGRAYLTMVGQQRAIETSERARDTARAHLEFARARLQGGVGNKLDEVRAAQEMAVAEAQLQGARLGLARAREALAVLVGSETSVDISGEVALETPSPQSPQSERAPQRSDYQLAEIRLRAAQRAVDQKWTEFSPTLTGIFQPFYQTPATPTLPTWGWQAQLVLTLPIFDGGFRYGLLADRQAQVIAAQEVSRGVARQIRSEERVAREAVQRADEALVAAQEAARLAETSLELASQAYRAGATTNLEIIDAERRARDAATSAVIAEDSVRQARFDWMVSAGRMP